MNRKGFLRALSSGTALVVAAPISALAAAIREVTVLDPVVVRVMDPGPPCPVLVVGAHSNIQDQANRVWARSLWNSINRSSLMERMTEKGGPIECL